MVDGITVAVTGDIEPIDRHALTVVGRGQGAVHHVFVGFLGGVGHVGIDHLGRRRQAEEVHVHAAHERFLVGFRRGFDAFGFELGEDEMVDRSARPGLVFDFRHGWLLGGDKRPVGLVFGSLADPLGERGDLLLGHRGLFRVGRGHDRVRIGGDDALEKETLLRLAGNDAVARRFAFLGQVRAGMLLGIKPERAGLIVGIRPVTGEAIVRKDREDLGAEGNFFAHRGIGFCRSQRGISG